MRKRKLEIEETWATFKVAIIMTDPNTTFFFFCQLMQKSGPLENLK